MKSMSTYNFMVTECLRRSVRVLAESEEEARVKVEERFRSYMEFNEEDFDGREISPLSEFTHGRESTFSETVPVNDDYSDEEVIEYGEIVFNAGENDKRAKYWKPALRKAREEIDFYALQHFGFDTEKKEALRERFIEEHPAYDCFDKSGEMLVIV